MPNWLVIATEDETGDPLFADISELGWPVYTAAHGEGAWVPEAVADTFASFVAALEALRVIARGRETPAALKQRPISVTERDQLLRAIATNNPDSSLTFWQTWLEPL